MALRRVFVDELDGDQAIARGDRARHLSRVARLKPGEAVEVSNFECAWRAVAHSVADREVRFRLEAQLPSPPSAPAIELQLALIKFPRLEWAVEKAAELGVESILPVQAERSDGGLAKAAAKRGDRWRRIAEEAAQQARRLRPPDVLEPVELGSALERPADVRLWCDFQGEPLAAPLLVDALAHPVEERRVVLLVGPEGGWADAERTAAIAAGSQPIRLAAPVLRAETAALAAIAIVAQLLLQPSR